MMMTTRKKTAKKKPTRKPSRRGAPSGTMGAEPCPRTSERSGRAQDKESEDAFEKLRRDGYM